MAVSYVTGSSGNQLRYSSNAPNTNSNGTPINRLTTPAVLQNYQKSLESAGSGTSAASVSQTQDLPSSLSDYMSWINELTDRNTARSEAQAAELRDWQSQQNQIAMQFNSAEAAKNRDWQKMMSDTAHQREVRDLQAAGLNPVLSAMGGNGASVTSGATASGVTSAGAKGDVDTSASSALVGILGSLLTAQTELMMQQHTAQNNMAIAEKNNATNELIARLYTEQSREASELAAATSLSTAEISAATSQLIARINSQSNITSAGIYAEAQKVAAQYHLQGVQYSSLVGGLYDLAVAQENHKNSLYGTANTWLEGVSDLFNHGINIDIGSTLDKFFSGTGGYSGNSAKGQYYTRSGK